MDLYSLIAPYLEGLPWFVKFMLSAVLPSILTAAFLGKILKPLLRAVVTTLKEKTPKNLWPMLGAVIGVVLQLIFKYLGVEILPGDIGWELIALGVATGGVGAPMVREAFVKTRKKKKRRIA